MGIQDLLKQKALQAKSFVTGKPEEQSGDERYPEEAHGRIASVQTHQEESRAANIAHKTKSAIADQFSSTFKSAVGYQHAQPKGKIKKIPDNVSKNIPRTRVPVEQQKPSFINRQIDLSYSGGQGYTSNTVNEAFRWKQFEKKQQKPIGGLPSLRGSFEHAVGYEVPKEKKKSNNQKFTFIIKREKKPKVG